MVLTKGCNWSSVVRVVVGQADPTRIICIDQPPKSIRNTAQPESHVEGKQCHHKSQAEMEMTGSKHLGL